MKIDTRGKKVLFISDQHIPAALPGYIRFLKHIKEKFKPDIIINGGDEVNGAAISFHQKDEELLSAGHELDRAIIEIQEGLHRLFPKMYLLESNHGSLLFRKMKANGIPVRALKPLHELYETPLWEWHDKILLITNKGKTICSHGMSGVAGAWAKVTGCSTVEFHYHTMFHITYLQSMFGMRYSMHCGCLADQEKLEFDYAKSNLKKFINGTGGIKANGEPFLIPYFDPGN